MSGKALPRAGGASNPDRRRSRTPTVVLGGTKDAVFPVAEQQALVVSIPGATFTLLDDIGHAVHWEKPEALAALFR
jgi:pimeloyl-ACP methyl ester carboxylesterase